MNVQIIELCFWSQPNNLIVVSGSWDILIHDALVSASQAGVIFFYRCKELICSTEAINNTTGLFRYFCAHIFYFLHHINV